MTEQEAKTKWCPMVPVKMVQVGIDDYAQSRARCIGSECMMWRVRKWDTYPDGQCPPEPTEGYCGLAGKP